MDEAVAAVRELDAAHLRRVDGVRGEFYAELRPHDRPVIAGHRAEVEGIVREAAALVVAGGHVGVLADVLHLFNLAPVLGSGALGAGGSGFGGSGSGGSGFGGSGSGGSSFGGSGAPVIAWSAGAMALTDRIVLFGDRSPQGPGHAEVYGAGLSVLRDVVLLPHGRARLLLDDTPRMAVFARRFSPARCVLLDTGTRIDLGGDGDWPGGGWPGGGWPAGTRVLAEDGHVSALEAA